MDHSFPSARQFAWVPYPGTKRKAESSEEDYSPPNKLIAFDEAVVDYVLKEDRHRHPASNSSLPSSSSNNFTEGLVSPSLSPPSTEGGDDEEMKELITQSDFNFAGGSSRPTFSFGAGGTTKHDDIGGGNIGMMHDRNKIVGGGSTCDNNCSAGDGGILMMQPDNATGINISPKIYFHEDVREALSKQRNADLMLEQVLKKEEKPSMTTAVVPWVDPLQYHLQEIDEGVEDADYEDGENDTTSKRNAQKNLGQQEDDEDENMME